MSKHLRVFRNQHVCELQGPLLDSIKLEPFENLFTGATYLDLSLVDLVTWHGLIVLLEFLKEKKFNLKFRKVPTHAFEVIRLQCISTPVEMESIEISYFKSDSQNEILKKYIDFSILMDLLYKQEYYVRAPDGGWVLGPITHWMPGDLLMQFEEFHLKQNGTVSGKEMLFWANYIGFVQSTLQVSENALAGIVTSLQIRGGLIEARIQSSINAIAILTGEQAQEFTSIQGVFLSALEVVNEALGKAIAKIDWLTEKVQDAYINNENILTELDSLPHFLTTDLKEVVLPIEQCGAEIFAKLCEHYTSAIYKDKLSTLLNGEISAEQLKKIRDAFCILDFFSEGDKELTASQVMEEISSIDIDTMSCIIDMQSFDVTRQMIEHRIHEGEIISTLLPSRQENILDWTSIHEEVTCAAKSKLVTEQEKASFLYFFKDKPQGEKIPTGEVVFF